MTFNERLGAVCVTALLAAACGGGSQSSQETAKPAAAPQATTAAAPAAAAPVAVAAGDFGVPECDEYVRKYLACIDGKVPEAARGMLKQSLDQTRDAWKKAAATPQGRAGLTAGCTQAMTGAKQAMTVYGCQW